MDIYWIADNKKCGPASVPDVISLVQMGEISPDTKGWHAGCEKWVPLRELPALVDFLQEKSPDEPAEELPPVPDAHSDSETDERPAGVPPNAVRVYLPSPASRLLARLADMAMYMALVFGVVYVRDIPFNSALLPSSPLVWIGFVVLETILVHYLGTTPGKALLGIQVRCVGEGDMSIGRSLSRTCLVFIGGVGMMVSILPLFMMGYSWWQLRSRGITMWDARCNTLPLMFKPASVLRQLLAVVLIFACFNMTSLCMQPWLHDMVTAIEQQSPEAGQWMRSMMPAEEK